MYTRYNIPDLLRVFEGSLMQKQLEKIKKTSLREQVINAIRDAIIDLIDTLGKADQTKVLIHELMHIPHAFGGGFRSHRPYVTKRKVEKMYQQFLKAR